jgi:hypothetical protein
VGRQRVGDGDPVTPNAPPATEVAQRGVGDTAWR